MYKLYISVIIFLTCYASIVPLWIIEPASANSTSNHTTILHDRIVLYQSLSAVTNISWHWIAAIDQYERSLTKAKPKVRPQLGQLTGIYIDERSWAGDMNPDAADNIPFSIQWFDGIGKDGNDDGIASRHDDVDLLYSVLLQVGKYGINDETLAIGVWNYYQNSRSVQRIKQFAHIYRHFDTLDLFNHSFPLPLKSSYSYKNTWGDSRGWGGRRIHEGTDLFASYGTPVRSTCYGIVEIKGWNRYGGWRVGIRDINNYYHYFAHLSGFAKELTVGQVVEPGMVVGWVGSSGYGKPGTSGKFPPHLHYGMYSDRGFIEWAFDPYPSLRRWEQEERKRLR